jgi:hypothetical protein
MGNLELDAEVAAEGEAEADGDCEDVFEVAVDLRRGCR